MLGTLETGWLDWLIDLHHNLLSGKSGRKAVGVAGIFLFGLSATGVWIWLLGARSWRTLVTVRHEVSSRRFHFELHRAAGMWTCGFLFLMSFTGVDLAFPDTFRLGMQAFTGMPPKEHSARVPKTKAATSKAAMHLDDYVSSAKTAMPDGIPVELRLPESKGGVEVQMRAAGDLGPAANHVWLDPATGRVLAIDRVADRLRGVRLLAAFKPIHYGQVGGGPIRILWGLGGLVPALLFVTGLITWWKPSKRKTAAMRYGAGHKRRDCVAGKLTSCRLIPILLSAVCAAAQSAHERSVVSGVVLDSSGAVVPGGRSGTAAARTTIRSGFGIYYGGNQNDDFSDPAESAVPRYSLSSSGFSCAGVSAARVSRP